MSQTGSAKFGEANNSALSVGKNYLYRVILFWAFILFAAIQCRYMFYTFMRIFSLREGVGLAAHQRQPVSIIICAHNEAQNLLQNLPLILSQRYANEAGIPLYELIVVDDCSNDNTGAVLEAFRQQYAHLKVISLSASDPRVLKGKKHALSAGASHATGKWLLLTDADCQPAGNMWLELMVAPLAAEKEIVAGYGGYNKQPGLLNAFIRWETMHTFIQYGAAALAGRPYMAVGRNMACTKQVLEQAQRSAHWNALPSGDDDLLVSAAATAGNMAVIGDPRAFTRSDAKQTWVDWARQKQRHLSAGKYYKWPAKVSLALYASSHAITWLLFAVLMCIHHPLWPVVAVYMAFRCVLYWAVWSLEAKRLQEKKLFYFLPLFDLGWMLYNFAFFPYITWKNKNTWT